MLLRPRILPPALSRLCNGCRQETRGEAQKQLIEINKQQIADPRLVALYDDDQSDFEQELKNPVFMHKLRSFAYMKLNMFELVLAHLPEDGKDSPVWLAYFQDSIARCTIMRQVIAENEALYSPRLIEAWRKALAGSRAAV
jgi:hypothetical protein